MIGWLRPMGCCTAGTGAWAGLALFAHSAPMAVGLLLVGSLSTACSDVVVDSIVVERSRGESQVTSQTCQQQIGVAAVHYVAD